MEMLGVIEVLGVIEMLGEMEMLGVIEILGVMLGLIAGVTVAVMETLGVMSMLGVMLGLIAGGTVAVIEVLGVMVPSDASVTFQCRPKLPTEAAPSKTKVYEPLLRLRIINSGVLMVASQSTLLLWA
jgi:hypothetical protein